MRTVLALMNRNRKLFFKDKGMLFTSMITPVILIVLYATFLAKAFQRFFYSGDSGYDHDFGQAHQWNRGGTADSITYGGELYHCNILCESDYGAGQGKWNKEGF